MGLKLSFSCFHNALLFLAVGFLIAGCGRQNRREISGNFEIMNGPTLVVRDHHGRESPIFSGQARIQLLEDAFAGGHNYLRIYQGAHQFDVDLPQLALESGFELRLSSQALRQTFSLESNTEVTLIFHSEQEETISCTYSGHCMHPETHASTTLEPSMAGPVIVPILTLSSANRGVEGHSDLCPGTQRIVRAYEVVTNQYSLLFRSARTNETLARFQTAPVPAARVVTMRRLTSCGP